MYLDIKLTDNLKPYKMYALCYVEPILIWIDEQEAEHPHRVTSKPNPEYIEGKQEMYAYFTPLSLDVQFGEDWDCPYENGNVPYDCGLIDGAITDWTILRVPFSASYGSVMGYEWNAEQPFTVQELNTKAAAWIYDFNHSNGKHTAIYAGVCPQKFKKLIGEITKSYKR